MRHGAVSLQRSGFAWAFAVMIALVLLSRFDLLWEAPDKWTYDWRTALFSQRAEEQRSDIAVLLIDEEGYETYPVRSPVDRALLAELIRAVDSAGAKAIGIDIILDQATAKDDILIAAIQEARAPVIMGAIDERSLAAADRFRPALERRLAFQYDMLARIGRPAGHLYFGLEKAQLRIADQTIRIRGTPLPGSRISAGFTDLLADIDGVLPKPASRLISWLLPPSGGAQDTFATFRLRRHEPVTGAGRAEEALPVSWRAALANRIVLIGGDFVDRDQHFTPLSVQGGARSPGLLIHAQVLAQILDGRQMHSLSAGGEAIALLLLTLIGVHIAERRQLPRFAAEGGGLAVLVIIGALAFSSGLVLPTTSLLTAWIAGTQWPVWRGALTGRINRRRG